MLLNSGGEGHVSKIEVDKAGTLSASILRAYPDRAAVVNFLVLSYVLNVSIGVEELSGTMLSSEELAEVSHNENIINCLVSMTPDKTNIYTFFCGLQAY